MKTAVRLWPIAAAGLVLLGAVLPWAPPGATLAPDGGLRPLLLVAGVGALAVSVVPRLGSFAPHVAVVALAGALLELARIVDPFGDGYHPPVATGLWVAAAGAVAFAVAVVSRRRSPVESDSISARVVAMLLVGVGVAAVASGAAKPGVSFKGFWLTCVGTDVFHDAPRVLDSAEQTRIERSCR